MASSHSRDDTADAVAAAFAAWGTRVEWRSIAESTRVATSVELLDFAGALIAGRAVAGMPAWLDVLLPRVVGPDAAVAGGTRSAGWSAAMANGYFGHVLELDDTHDVAVLHAGASAIPAALAAAEMRGGVDGPTLLAGVLAGIEMNCRLGIATDLSLVEGGWIYSSLLGHFGAALAAARVLGLDEARTRDALGIAYCHACGNHQSSREGAPTKHVQPGIAAGNGLKAALMAARGLRAVAAPFGGEDGFARVYLRGRFDPDVATRGLGERFEIERLSFKPYPSCRLTHPAVSAALELRERLGPDIDRVDRVRIAIGAQALDVVGRAEPFRLHPRRWLDAQFSVFWAVAVALSAGRVSPAELIAEVPPSTRLRAWIARIEARPLGEGSTRDVGACTIEAHGAFGVVQARAEHALGHPDHPLSRDEVVAKFRDNLALAGIDAAGATTHAHAVLGLGDDLDCGALLRLLAWPIAAEGRRTDEGR